MSEGGEGGDDGDTRMNGMEDSQEICSHTAAKGLPISEISSVVVEESFKDSEQKFLQGYVWDGVNSLGSSPAIESSLFAAPFRNAPSLSEDVNTAFVLKQYNHLFKIVTPIKVDKMETLLVNHPNRPFVLSALKGLREGFWPNSSIPSSTVVDGPNHVTCGSNQTLLEEQCQEEIDKGRYSEEFTTLLLGMKVIPLLMVSKKDSTKMRVCSNMSAGRPSPNDLIDKDSIPVAYDSLRNFIPYLIQMKEKEGDVILFKSDIEGAFELFRFIFSHSIPLPQAKLLNLSDILGFPWVWKKQIFGSSLEIIGHLVDSEKMTIQLHPDKKTHIIETLKHFVSGPQHSLNNWQKLLGHASWACTSMPWGRYALQSLYKKSGNKSHRFLQIPLNKENQNDLRWLIKFFSESSGIMVLESLKWGLNEADGEFFTDACMTGVGIWEPSSRKGNYFILPPPPRNIYWAELLGVISAIGLGIRQGFKRIFVHSDNRNVVDLFSSHAPNKIVRPLFCHCVMQLVEAGADVKVVHVSADFNSAAAALSQQKLILTPEKSEVLCHAIDATEISYLKIDPFLLSGVQEVNLTTFDSSSRIWLNPNLPVRDNKSQC
ncbi:uncharacterized protein MELLADRAFT_84147 [Melampsora larici-populina 98AG31]|uniref:RNase H type-1 domain-containing protein n=1 Tax=Melampsora larici-populina (strain 98AG31 / pathotype 3-4-7) TaxID=747676 RepID=F4SBN8_MELLP|nr:uncharacterized protein MELLADRAFT_84147 [Melampsora larici-populina 98AG31]EGF97942.1 hypothetical protein MELLADRAFT_84147 [Melampsora larici-populina 98AG31]